MKTALRQGQHRAAILHYRNALKLDQRYGRAHEKLASTLLAIGEAEEAYPSLLRAVELLPDDRGVLLRLTDYTQRVYLGDPARHPLALREVEDLAQKLISRWPTQSEGYRYQSFVLTERHRHDEAVTLLQGALKKTGPDASILCDLASIHHNQQRLQQSRAILRELVAAQTPYEPAYDLLYLQLMEARLTLEAGAVLQAKSSVSRTVDAALQYAAHLHATGNAAGARESIDQLSSTTRTEPDAWLRIGDFWMNRGELQRAHTAFQRGFQEQPKLRTTVTGRLVELNLAAHKRNEARALLKAELTRTPKDDTLAAYRAALDLDEQEPGTRTKARLELESILMRMPTSAFVRYHRGRAYLRVGDTMRASAHLERCVRLDPNYAPGWLALAESDFSQGNLLRAKSRVAGLLSRAPNHPTALLLNARLQKSLGRLDEAESSLQAASHAGADRQELLLERAALELQRGRHAQTLELLKKEWDGPQNDERYLSLQARAEFAAGQRQSALDRLSRELALAPQSNTLRELYAALLAGSGQLPAALAQYTELRKSNPGQGQFALAVADLMALTGKLQESVNEYRAAGQAMPNNPNVWLRYAAVLTSSGDTRAAQDAYTKALALDSSNPMAMNNLAYLLARSGQNLDYALQLAQEAERAMPQSRETLDTLTYIHLRTGMKRAALENFDRLIRTARPEDRSTLEASRDDARRGELPQAARRLEIARDNRAARNGGVRL